MLVDRAVDEPARPVVVKGAAVRRVVLGLAALGGAFLVGLLGVGGGFVIPPVMTTALGIPAEVAVGTSLLVISSNSALSLLARLGSSALDWTTILPVAVAAAGAIVVGKRWADRTGPSSLRRTFAVRAARSSPGRSTSRWRSCATGRPASVAGCADSSCSDHEFWGLNDVPLGA